jgi:PPP family 3-phenylpropionic acid transporter
VSGDSLARRAAPLSAYWFLVMGPIGLVLPYYALYLRENAGLSGAEVGAVFAVMPLVGMVQPLWGLAADRTGLRARMLVLLSAGAAVGLWWMGRARGFAALLVATAAMAVFMRTAIPMALSVSLPSLADRRHAFGLVRAAGTVGFLLAVLGFPSFLDRYQAAHGLARAAGGPSEPGLDVLFPMAAVLSILAALAALAIPNRGAVAVRAHAGEWRGLLRDGRFRRVVAVCFAAFLWLNGPMELFPILVNDRGGDLDTVRTMWIGMLLPEIALVAFLGSALHRFGPRSLLMVGIGAGAVRWLLCAWVHDLAWLFPVQTLHAVVVAGLLLGGPLYVEAVVPPQLRSTAQALLGTVAVGLGGVGSSLLAGFLLERAGPSAPYWVGGLGAAGLTLLVPAALPRVR